MQLNLTGLTVGQDYQLQGLFWDDGKKFSVRDADNTSNNAVYESGDAKGYSWTAIWTADATSKNIEVYRWTRATLAGVSLQAIPEPATFGLFAVFGGAALFIRKRHMI